MFADGEVEPSGQPFDRLAQSKHEVVGGSLDCGQRSADQVV
jgi:hypothetical protein